MHLIIAFDVSEDRRRYRVVRALQALATRVQKSVFEALAVDEAAYLRLRSRAEREIDPATDQLRYYRLCASCAAKVEHFGSGPPPPEPDEPFRILGP